MGCGVGERKRKNLEGGVLFQEHSRPQGLAKVRRSTVRLAKLGFGHQADIPKKTW